MAYDDLLAAFRRTLAERRREEIARGMTLVGPHRDELRFLANGLDLGEYGSRGQQRTAVLALKLAQAQWMREHTGEDPVLLLDEVLAELDPTAGAASCASSSARIRSSSPRPTCSAWIRPCSQARCSCGFALA
jgi:recombinational DNA repair ATPase RecF